MERQIENPFENPFENPVNNEGFVGIESTFNRYFEVVPASTPALLDQTYALRYRVYCMEHRFEDPSSYPTGQESDGHDLFSRHVALVYRPSREVIGTVRLIFPGLGEEGRLPIMARLGREAEAELLRYPRDRMAEISRYVVSKTFRQRHGEDEFPDMGYSPVDDQTGRRLMPHLTLGLMRGILQLGVAGEVQYFCACMRPALLRLLRRFGLVFKLIGPPVDYHGFRQPCIASIDDLLLGLKTQQEQLCRVVQCDL